MTGAVMIFAAGFGTRMGALTRNTPKPLLKVAGKALIDHALDRVAEAQIDRIVVNTHYLANQLHDHLDLGRVLISHEESEILDTGGGLRAALGLLDTSHPMTLNPDVLWLGPNPLSLLRDHWDPDHMDGLLMCIPLGQTHGRTGGGDFGLTADNRLRRGGDLVYGGAQILRIDDLNSIPDHVFSLNRVWDLMNARGRLRALSYPGEWCDVGRPENIELAETLLATRDV